MVATQYYGDYGMGNGEEDMGPSIERAQVKRTGLPKGP